MSESVAGSSQGGLAGRFEQIVRAQPEHPAVSWPGGNWSYRELNRIANRLARRLLAEGVTPGTVVALVLNPTRDLPAALLAIWKVAAVALPLDPALPPQRMEALCRRAGVRLVLGSHATGAVAQRIVEADRPLVRTEDAGEGPSDDVSLSIHPASPADICFTSGTTGEPKGVFHTHASRWVNTRNVIVDFDFEPSDRLTMLHRAGVASSISEILAGLLVGATLCPIDLRALGTAAAAAQLRDHRATIVYWVPSGLRALLGELPGGERLESVRLVVLGSEPVTRRDVEIARRAFAPGVRIANRYGATETGNLCAYTVDDRTSGMAATLPIGWPSRHREIRLITASGADVPPGETGEIVVRSRFLAGGYWRDPALTAEEFLPVEDDPEAREYHTGDLGRFRPDGALEHLGRGDFVVKLRANRVNLVEVESLAASLPGVRAAAAAVRPVPNGPEQLLLYIQPEDGAGLQTAEVRGYLAMRLPAASVPTTLLVVDDLPRTAGGKLDRGALPAPRTYESSEVAAPHDALETRLVETWREVLGCETVGVDHDFFELGGDSIRAAVLLNRLQSEFQRALSPTLLFEAGTIRSLAERIREAECGDGVRVREPDEYRRVGNTP